MRESLDSQCTDEQCNITVKPLFNSIYLHSYKKLALV